MHLRLAVLAILPLLALSCGGGSKAPTFASATEAAAAAARAMAGGDLEVAAAAFQKAAEAADPAAKTAALSGLFQAYLKDGKSQAAIAAAQRLIAEGGAMVDSPMLKGLADAAIVERNAEVANAVIDAAVAKFPAAKMDYAKALQAVDLLKTQGAGADLSSLGYTGD
jgi:tetratricopeptide (TPR) repeat protein